jgi:hypothetical protein
MKTNLACAAVLFAAGSLLAADPKDDVAAAAKALGNTGNFTWTQRVLLIGLGGNGAAAAAPTSIDTMGMTDKGFIFTSNNLNGVDRETVVKGTNGAAKAVPFGGGDAVWRTWEEAAAATAAAMGANGGGGGRGPGAGRPGAGGRLGIGRYGEDRFALPTDQVADILSNVVSITMAGNTYTGDLTGAEATNRLTPPRGGRGGGGGLGGGGRFVPTFTTDAKGTVTFTLKNGMLASCLVKVTGKSPAAQGGDAIDYGSETTIEFSNVGGTKLPVPDDIIAKISK